MQKFLIVLGILVVLIGLLWPVIIKLGIGQLPGDIMIKRNNFTFYFPLATSLLLSIIVSLIWYFINK